MVSLSTPPTIFLGAILLCQPTSAQEHEARSPDSEQVETTAPVPMLDSEIDLLAAITNPPDCRDIAFWSVCCATTETMKLSAAVEATKAFCGRLDNRPLTAADLKVFTQSNTWIMYDYSGREKDRVWFPFCKGGFAAIYEGCADPLGDGVHGGVYYHRETQWRIVEPKQI